MDPRLPPGRDPSPGERSVRRTDERSVRPVTDLSLVMDRSPVDRRLSLGSSTQEELFGLPRRLVVVTSDTSDYTTLESVNLLVSALSCVACLSLLVPGMLLECYVFRALCTGTLAGGEGWSWEDGHVEEGRGRVGTVRHGFAETISAGKQCCGQGRANN